MSRALLSFLLLILVAAVPASAPAADTSRYVLPPGNFGGLPTSENSLDQLPLYTGLTPLRRNVTAADVNRLYLPMDFKPIGTTRVEPTPNSGVTITYDQYGIPHIKGQTRSALMYGAGWVMARDRRLLLEFGRWPARVAWFLAIVGLGSIAVTAFCLRELFRVPANAKLEDVLLRHPR